MSIDTLNPLRCNDLFGGDLLVTDPSLPVRCPSTSRRIVLETSNPRFSDTTGVPGGDSDRVRAWSQMKTRVTETVAAAMLRIPEFDSMRFMH